MALQDLTPQLRTRLSRMERAVGWFVMLALTALAFGFGYYLYNTAQRKGWFLTKAPYFTFVQSAIGLKPGDPVKLMGFDAGSITKIEPMPGDQFDYNVYVEFVLKAPNYGYIWTEGSQAKIATADFLGKRVLEVSKGVGGYPTYVFGPLRVLTPDAGAKPAGSNQLGLRGGTLPPRHQPRRPPARAADQPHRHCPGRLPQRHHYGRQSGTPAQDHDRHVE